MQQQFFTKQEAKQLIGQRVKQRHRFKTIIGIVTAYWHTQHGYGIEIHWATKHRITGGYTKTEYYKHCIYPNN